MLMRTTIVALAAAGLLCGCRTPTGSTAAIAKADAALSQADLGAAATYAPLELRLAREKLAQAEEELRDDRPTEARRLAEQALVDVQLAEAKAQSAAASAAADDLRRGVETIENEASEGAAPGGR
jgi:hypothetical protein